MGEGKAPHRYDMGVIGNCSYMGYVDVSGNVRWMCWPRFDSPFIFGNLLDQEKGGYFYIRPASEGWESKQYYLPNTNILCTEFRCADGGFRVVDFAPRFAQYERHYKPLMLVRKVEPLDNHPEVVAGCKPGGGGLYEPPKAYRGSNHIQYLGLERPLRLTTDFPLDFVMEEQKLVLDRPHYFCLTYGLPLEAPLETTMESFLGKTRDYWEGWVHSATIPSFCQEEVIRSALVLKLHQYQDTGAIIASGTTSLPEHPGSGRNWDYRFCWLRDSYYTLEAFQNLGHFEELQRYSTFIQNVAGIHDERCRPVYPITGQDESIQERILDLDGYLGNKPVRIGNQATEHIQNDLYGQVLVSLLPLYTDARFVNKNRDLALRNTRALLEGIEATIDSPDAGLWEFRNKEQKHSYTFLFHWAGAHAAAKVADFFGDDELLEKAKGLIEQARQNVEACYDADAGVYRQAMKSQNLDASLFQLITMQFIDPASEKAQQHLDVLARELQGEWPLMYRYRHQDDFGKPKSTFLVCAWWYIEALATAGRAEEALEGFKALLKYSNHLGLFSEDVDEHTGSQWGNFPQTYSHVGLVNAAFLIDRKLNKPVFLTYGE